MYQYATIFENKPTRPVYSVAQLYNDPTKVPQRIIPENQNLKVYMDNLEFYKNEVKLFNYVGPTVIKNRQDDFKY